MFLVDDMLVTSASDLTLASKCEFAFLRKLDVLRGRAERIEAAPDALLERTSRLGDAHEERVLEQYRQRFGDGVVSLERPDPLTVTAMRDAAATTLRAFELGADVVFQATMFEEDAAAGMAFVGFADFIARQPDGSYRVEDTKLARSEKVTAVLQLAAYAEQLKKKNVVIDERVTLLLGNGEPSHHHVDDLLPVYRVRRRRLEELLGLRDSEGATGAKVLWGDSRFSVCGACEHCVAEIDACDDVLRVAGLSRGQREKLGHSSIQTMRELAESAGEVEGIGARTLSSLRLQASLQLASAGRDQPPVEVIDPAAISSLPAPDAGDIFFDFEGDPLYTQGDGSVWGLDYLFGLVETDGTFRSFWAHDFSEEAAALRDFLGYLTHRRTQHPGMHVYHYASYERTHLASLAIRHGFGEDIIDDLFREHVLVDLYPVVRSSIRVGTPSYSIKKLEPLYMGDDLRDDDGVTTAGDSIVEYSRAVEFRDGGDIAAFDRKLKDIEDYNAYDCRSTLRLNDWLRTLVTHGSREQEPPASGSARVPNADLVAEAELAERLLGLTGDRTTLHDDPDRLALALAAAAVGYHVREDKKQWWEHFARLLQPIDEWIDNRGVFDVDEVVLARDWYKEGRQRNLRRELSLRGSGAPGSAFRASSQLNEHVLYEADSGVARGIEDPGARIARKVMITDVSNGQLSVLEVLKADETPHDAFPVALVPGGPIPSASQRKAISEWARGIVDGHPHLPKDAAFDIVRRVPPRTLSGGLPAIEQLDAERLASSVRDLDDSYLAVQGPPGTGKTYIGARAIRSLASGGFTVGVTGQSHAVIGNFLEGVVTAGLATDDVVHVGSDCGGDHAHVESGRVSAWVAERAGRGYVIGGTVWAFSNPNQIGRRTLDLLVIDEAGQFSLANTIAASVAAHRVLLLGDPQQLPQVTQGSHPQPIDESALGWIMRGEEVLPGEYGYFLPTTRRMVRELTAPVSRLSYRGRLRSHEDTEGRALDGIEPGLHVLPIGHRGSSVSSQVEADAVVSIVSSLIRRPWSSPSDGRADDPLQETDFIVITPYNAQRELVLEALRIAGYPNIPVGTVDKFQGREAVVAIVSLAASDASEVPRGMEFLINRNRLNVAISRAKWASWIIYSPGLVEHLPATVGGLKELSAFIALVGADASTP